MKEPDSEQKKMDGKPSTQHTLTLFAERNRIYQIIYNSIGVFVDATEADVYKTMTVTLKKICAAEKVFVAAARDSERHCFFPHTVADGETVSVLSEAEEHSFTLPATVHAASVDSVMERERSAPWRLGENIPAAIRDRYRFSRDRTYQFVCKRKNMVFACGLIQFENTDIFLLADMVVTYLGLVAVFLEHSTAVHELARSNERFRHLLEQAPMGMVLIDRQKKVVEINKAALFLLQKDKKEVLGKICQDLFCLKDGMPCPVFDENVEEHRAEVLVKAAGDQAIPVLKSATHITIDNEPYVFETFIDIYDRKKAEQEKLDLEKQLYQAQKLEAIGTLAAGIAHEINTPIQFISDNTAFMENAFKSFRSLQDAYKAIIDSCGVESEKERISHAFQEAEQELDIAYVCQELPLAIQHTQEGLERVRTIVGVMKDFSHFGADEKVATDLNASIEKAVVITKNEWKYVADVAVACDKTIPQVLCYRSEINQILINLIINASHAIKDVVAGTEQKGAITITTMQKNMNIRVAISDTGKGISPEIRHRVFEQFFTTKPVGQGTGQGLAMAYKSIVERHGGRIWFESEVGKGTTFYFDIPLNVQEGNNV